MQREEFQRQINTLISNQQQSRMVEKLLNKKLNFNNRKHIDPIYSELFIVYQQNNHKKKKKRVKTLRDQKTKLQKSNVSYQKEKALTEMKRHNRSFSYGNSIQLPKISNNFKHSQKEQIKSVDKIRKMQTKTQLEYLPSISSKKQKIQQISHTKTGNIIQDNKGDSKGDNKGDNKEDIKTKRFNTLSYQQEKKMSGKKIMNKKIKFQINKKQSQSNILQKNINQWKQIDILKLQTFFVKLKKLKNNGILTHSKIQLSKNIPHTDYSLPPQFKIPDYIKYYTVRNPKISVDNLVRSQKFGVLFEEGLSLYFGGLENGKKSGFGIFVNRFSKFQGLWKKDEKVEGCQITSNGQYHGRFKNNKRHGQGKFIWYNGQTYQGEWDDGVKNGLGVWKSGKGDSYIGQWVKGKVQGQGVHITATGQRYEGNFKDFLKFGSGKQTFPNGDKYEGLYKYGNPDGKGKYIWKNNIVFIGEFKQGYRTGKGKIIAQNYLKFEGNFDRDLPCGEGILEYQNGDKYIGDFLKGQRHGLGTFNIKSEQKILTGIWKNNKFQFDKE